MTDVLLRRTSGVSRSWKRQEVPREGVQPRDTFVLYIWLPDYKRVNFCCRKPPGCDNVFWWPQDTGTGSVPTGALPLCLPAGPQGSLIRGRVPSQSSGLPSETSLGPDVQTAWLGTPVTPDTGVEVKVAF